MERDRRRHQLALRLVVALVVAVLVVVLSLADVWRGGHADGEGERVGDATTSSAPVEKTNAAAGDGESRDEGGTSWDSSHTTLVERVVGSGRMRLYEDSSDLESCAAELLRSYEESGDCVLVRSGYLDLVGSVWSCTVRGSEGVDVCFVCERADGEGCQVRVLSMGESEWKDLYAQVEKATLP